MLLTGFKKYDINKKMNYLISTNALLKTVGQEVQTYSPYDKISVQAETGSEKPATCKHKEKILPCTHTETIRELGKAQNYTQAETGT